MTTPSDSCCTAIVPYVAPSLEIGGGEATTFPEAVHDMVSYAERNEIDAIVWTNNGEAFRVDKDHERLGGLLLKFFRHDKYSSLQRQLNMYGFKKYIKGRFGGAFHHPYFHRDESRCALSEIRRRPPPRVTDKQLSTGCRKRGLPRRTRHYERNRSTTPPRLRPPPPPPRHRSENKVVTPKVSSSSSSSSSSKPRSSVVVYDANYSRRTRKEKKKKVITPPPPRYDDEPMDLKDHLLSLPNSSWTPLIPNIMDDDHNYGVAVPKQTVVVTPFYPHKATTKTSLPRTPAKPTITERSFRSSSTSRDTHHGAAARRTLLASDDVEDDNDDDDDDHLSSPFPRDEFVGIGVDSRGLLRPTNETDPADGSRPAYAFDMSPIVASGSRIRRSIDADDVAMPTWRSGLPPLLPPPSSSPPQPTTTTATSSTVEATPVSNLFYDFEEFVEI